MRRYGRSNHLSRKINKTGSELIRKKTKTHRKSIRKTVRTAKASGNAYQITK
jgi:hypothetical protein